MVYQTPSSAFYGERLLSFAAAFRILDASLFPLERHTILAFAEYRVFFFCIFGMGILFAARFWGLRGVRYGILDEKEAAVSWVVYLGFTNGEYHIALVDFIGSSRGRLERDRGF